jgi:hypothetical protein
MEGDRKKCHYTRGRRKSPKNQPHPLNRNWIFLVSRNRFSSDGVSKTVVTAHGLEKCFSGLAQSGDGNKRKKISYPKLHFVAVA